MRQESYNLDLLDGKSQMWDKKGNLISVRNYKEGMLHGKVVNYDEEGKVVNQSTYKNGLRN